MPDVEITTTEQVVQIDTTDPDVVLIEVTDNPVQIEVGTSGPQGAQGPAGTTPTITVGTVSTGNAGTNAVVTNSGTSTNAVFDFTIPRGDNGGAYTHVQNAVSNTWVVNHNLGYYPQVTVVESGGSLVEGVIAYNSNNQLTITFSVSISGYAYIS